MNRLTGVGLALIAFAGLAAAQPVITTNSPLPTGVVGLQYVEPYGVFFEGTGMAPFVWSVVSPPTLPAGLSLSSGGILSGTPTTASPATIYTIQLTDGVGLPTTKQFSLKINTRIQVTTSSLPIAYRGVPYSATLAASGGEPGGYTWFLSDSSLPTGLSLNSSTGAITGTTTSFGSHNVSVVARDTASPQQESARTTFTLEVREPPLQITSPAELPRGVQSILYSNVLTATGGQSPYAWQLGSGGTGLPSGITLLSNGSLSGTTTSSGTFTFRATVNDSSTAQPQSQTQDFTLIINPTLVITTTSLPNAARGTPYTGVTFTSTGGQPGIIWTRNANAGPLPPGLTLNTNGSITGTPTTGGFYNFDVIATDSATGAANQVKNGTFSIFVTVPPVQITTPTPITPRAVQGVAYTKTLAATEGNTPYIWTLVSGALPPNFALSSAGVISGTTSSTGTFTFAVEVMDANEGTDERTFTLTVDPPLQISTNSNLPGAEIGTPYSQSLTAINGTSPYVNWTVTSGSLPAGISLNASTGALTGTPTAIGASSFTIQVQDSGTPQLTTSKAFTLSVSPTPLVVTTSNPLQSGNLTLQYSQPLSASGGIPPYSNWTVVAGSGTLPNGLSLNPSTGVISGIPTVSGLFNFVVQVFDASPSNGPPGSVPRSFTISVNTGDFRITTADPLNSGNVAVAYSQTLAATGGNLPYGNWTVVSGALPAGLTLNSSSGAITGTPTAPGAYDFTVRVSDGSNNGSTQFAEKPFRITINSGTLAITTATPLPAGAINSSYSQTFAASGGALPHVNWTVAAGSLPAGLTLNGFTGQLTGIPTESGVFNFTVQAQDSSSTPLVATKAFSLTISGAQITITTNSPLPPGNVGLPYSLTFAATGGTPPYVWDLSEESSLPPGLTLTSAGVLSGTPTTAGTYTFGIDVRGAAAASLQFGSKTFTLQIQLNPLTIVTATPLPMATLNTPYTQQITAAGGVPPYVWQIVSGALPAGVSFSSGGVLSGTPTQSGAFTFTVRVRDSLLAQIDRTFTLPVDAGFPIITTTALPGGQALQPYSVQLTAVGGTPPYTWAIASGSLPSGFALTTSGLVIGTAGGPISASFEARVNDSAGRVGTRTLAILIGSREEPTISTPEIATATLADGTVGKIYGMQFAARNGSPPYRWSFSGLPDGLVGGPDGEILGTPRRAGTFGVQVTVTDDSRSQTTGLFTLVINPSAVVISTERAPDGRVNDPYSGGFTATGGLSPYTFSVLSGSLPSGVSLSANGLLTGIPDQAGTFPFTVQATDSLGERGMRAYSILIQPQPIVITTASLGNGTVGNAFNASLAATGGTLPYTWAASGLPDGLGIDPASGVISGTPTRNGTFTVVATVTDQNNQTANRSYTVGITTVLVITTTSVGNMAVGIPVSTSLAATGGRLPHTWSLLAGSLPSGVGLGSDGVISGSPSAEGDSNFTVQVADANGVNTSKSFSTRVVAPLLITAQTLPAAPFGAAYSATLAATGGTAPYQWSLAGGNLPGGLQLSSAGVISGTPTAAGTFNFTVQVGDSNTPQFTTQRGFSIQVALPEISGLIITVPANPQPAQQPPITLQISAPYALDVTGTLVLTFSPNAANNADDPSIQFSTGGRSVTFTIPAGQTQAVFPVTALMIQTGTTAGTITLTPSLTAVGSPVNCNCPLTQTIVIPRTAPVITTLRVTRTATGFNVLVTGFSTSREVTQGVFRFAGATALQTTELTVPLATVFNAWFQSTAASSFGGQFSLTIPFTIQGDTSTVNSVTVTLTNGTGASQPSTTTF